MDRFPGAVSADGLAFEFPTLSYAGARGATHDWTIRVALHRGGAPVRLAPAMLAADLGDAVAVVSVESGQRGGKVRDVVPTTVSRGKNLGKKNATNALTQALRDALGLYNKHAKRADVVPAGPAAAGPAAPAAEAEVPAMPPPMLVRRLGESPAATLGPADFAAGVTVQRKLNGVHYVAGRPAPGAPLVRYSRSGTAYAGHEHLRGELEALLAGAPAISAGRFGVADAAAAAYRGAQPYLAGELYLHGKPLNWISGQARRSDAGDAEPLEFHVFDVFFPAAKAAGADMASRDRQAYLDALFASGDGGAWPHVRRVENFPAPDLATVEALARRFVAEGYEGAITRRDATGYRYSFSGYHATNALKVKPILDAEFPVVGFTQGTRGKDVGALVWICRVPDAPDPSDAEFHVVPKNMTYETRYALFRCLSEKVPGPGGARITRFERDLKGLPLTVEYPELAATGKPLQAKATVFRTYEAGPDADRARKLVAECGM